MAPLASGRPAGWLSGVDRDVYNATASLAEDGAKLVPSGAINSGGFGMGAAMPHAGVNRVRAGPPDRLVVDMLHLLPRQCKASGCAGVVACAATIDCTLRLHAPSRLAGGNRDVASGGGCASHCGDARGGWFEVAAACTTASYASSHPIACKIARMRIRSVQVLGPQHAFGTSTRLVVVGH
jgi:hypothetical protein